MRTRGSGGGGMVDFIFRACWIGLLIWVWTSIGEHFKADGIVEPIEGITLAMLFVFFTAAAMGATVED